MTSQSVPDRSTFRASLPGWALLLAGVLGGQFWLYGTSLVGSKLLAPTDLLVAPGGLNVVGEAREAQARHVMMDPVQVFYPWLGFAAREVRAGRLPTWNPYAYCGSPFLANMQSAVFSPFTAVSYVWPDPRALAWVALLKAVVAGVGAYGFLRSACVRTWPAVVGGWCYPLSGYLTVWLNYPLSAAAVWGPAGFWAVSAVLRRPRGAGGPALAGLVGLMLVSGHLETTAHVLLGMGLYGLGSWLAQSRGRVWESEARSVAGATALVLGLGLALGAAQVLPTLDYVGSSHRLKLRRERQAERGYADQTLRWEAVRLAFPLLAGVEQPGSRPLTATGIHESGANGFVGVTFLILVPVGLAAGWRRFETGLWLGLAVWFAAPMFRIPVLGGWDGVPPFHLAANSRALLLTGWGVLVLGVRGLDALGDPPPAGGQPRARAWGVGLSCGLAAAVLLGLLAAWLDPLGLSRSVPRPAWPWFRDELARAAVVTGLGLAGLLVWLAVPAARRGARVGLGLLAFGEVLATASGLNPQVPRSTYYPASPLCDAVAARVGGGRVCGLFGALPPNLAMAYGLRDVRGYDAVDPDPFVELMLATGGRSGPPHAITWQFACGPSPVLDLLGVRCVVSPVPVASFGAPAAEVGGVYLYENPRALPRAFVPRRAVVVADAGERLRRLGGGGGGFDPRAEVIVESAGVAPTGVMAGTAVVTRERPDRVTLRADCEAEAVVVLADGWSAGWRVTVDGRPAGAIRADHALRAVRVPRGVHEVVWSYEPAAVRRGLWVSGVGLVLLGLQSVRVARRVRE